MIPYETLSQDQKETLINLLSPHITLLELNHLWDVALAEKKLSVALQVKKLLIDLVWNKLDEGDALTVSTQEVQEVIMLVKKWKKEEKRE